MYRHAEWSELVDSFASVLRTTPGPCVMWMRTSAHPRLVRMMVVTCVEGNGTETACVCVLKVLVDLTVQQISASVHQQVPRAAEARGLRGCSPLQELEKGGLAPLPNKTYTAYTKVVL